MCVCILLTLVKRSLILDGTDKHETLYIKVETVSTWSIFMGGIIEVITETWHVLWAQKSTLNEGHIFAVQEVCRWVLAA